MAQFAVGDLRPPSLLFIRLTYGRRAAERCRITCLLDRLDEIGLGRGRDSLDASGFGRAVPVGLEHARDRAQRLFHEADTRRAARKSVGEGKSEAVRVALGGTRTIKNKQ